MNFVTSISLVVLGVMFLALLVWGSIRAAWRNCEGRRGAFAALAILAAVCSIVAQKPSPDTPTITVDALLRDVGCYATNNVFHAAVTNAPNYAGVDFSDCDLMVYARERASTNAASWFELTPRKKFSQQPADYAIENATNFNYMVYLNYVPPSPVHTNGVFELYGFVIENEAQGEPDQLAAGFINSRAVPLPFDAEVEYLESTGTQWIVTDTPGESGMTLGCEFSWPSIDTYSGNLVFGIYESSTTEFIPIWRDGNSKYTLSYGYGVFNGIKVSFAPNTRTTVTAFFDVGVQRVELNGAVIATGNSNYRHTISTPLSLFATFSGKSLVVSGTRVYHAFARVGNDMKMDFIPVRKGYVGYMYDRVSGQLFGNAGTGAFIVGPDK